MQAGGDSVLGSALIAGCRMSTAPSPDGAALPSQREARLCVDGLQDDLWDQGRNEAHVRGLTGHLEDLRVLRHAAEMVIAKKSERKPGRPGVDGVHRDQFRDRMPTVLPQLSEELRSGTYWPLPLKIVPVGGRLTGLRCYRDRVVEQGAVLLVEPSFRDRLHDGALGWRIGCGPPMAVNRVTTGLPQCDFIIRTDITACFPNMRHTDVRSALRERIRDADFLRVIQSLLITGADGEAPKNTDIHQGTILAPLLANIVLTQIDNAFAPGWGPMSSPRVEAAHDPNRGPLPATATATVTAAATAASRLPTSQVKNSGHNTDTTKDHNPGHHQEPRGSRQTASSSSASPLTHQPGRSIDPAPLCLYLRYGDDIVVLVQGSRVQAEQVKAFIEAGLLDLGLRLSVEKTQIATPKEGITFLGIDIRLDENGDLVKLVAQHKIEEWAGYLSKKIRNEGLGWRYQRDVRFKQKVRYFRTLGADMEDAGRRLSGALDKPRPSMRPRQLAKYL